MPFQRCPNCQGSVEYPIELRGSAGTCPFCGFQQWIGTTGPINSHQGVSPGVAAILSVFMPGLGQLCKGETGKGIAFFFITLLGYVMFILPGLVIHICVIVDAAQGQ